MTIQFGEKLMKSYEINRELDQIENELTIYEGYAVAVQEDDKIRFGHISVVDGENGRVLIDFGLLSASDYNQKFYTYQDFILGKIKVEYP
jgi:hypothetical protein